MFLHTRWNNVIPKKYLQEQQREARIGIVRPTGEALLLSAVEEVVEVDSDH